MTLLCLSLKRTFVSWGKFGMQRLRKHDLVTQKLNIIVCCMSILEDFWEDTPWL